MSGASQESVSSQDGELAGAYSEYLMESDDESGHVLAALRSSLQEARKRHAVGGGAASSRLSQRAPATPTTVQQDSRRAPKRSRFGSSRAQALDLDGPAGGGGSKAAMDTTIVVLSDCDDSETEVDTDVEGATPAVVDAIDAMAGALRAVIESEVEESAGRAVALGLLQQLDAQQLRAAHGVLALEQRVVVVSGPAGSGKSALMKLLVLVKGAQRTRVVAPTNGARRVCQKNIDEVLPPRSFKPELEALTTFKGFGAGWGEADPWKAETIVQGIERGESKRRKGAELYQRAELLVVDEGAQARACARAPSECGLRGRDAVMGGMQLVILMDAVQTPPVASVASDGRRQEMVWEADFFREAEAAGDLHEGF